MSIHCVSGNKKDTVLIVYHIAISEFLKNFFFTLWLKYFTYGYCKGFFPPGNIISCSWHNYNLRLEKDDHLRRLAFSICHFGIKGDVDLWELFPQVPLVFHITCHLIPSLTLNHPILEEVMDSRFDILANSIFPTLWEKPSARLWVRLFSINWQICLALKGWLDIKDEFGRLVNFALSVCLKIYLSLYSTLNLNG